MPNSTPGQIAYEAYERLTTPDVAWPHLYPNQHRAWEAAAQAVRDYVDFPPLDLAPARRTTMPNPTPGEVAYAAYVARMPRLPFVTYMPPYSMLEVGSRCAWEAAATAVLGLHEEKKGTRMNTINESTAASLPVRPTLPVLGRVGWICARCGRSYAPDVRECLGCTPYGPPGYTTTVSYPYVLQPQPSSSAGAGGTLTR